MKKSKFISILDSIEKDTKDIIDKVNDLIQDKNVSDSSILWSLEELLRDATYSLDKVNNIRANQNKDSQDFECVYGYDKPIEFDKED